MAGVKRALIADNSVAARNYFQRMLQWLNFDVVQAETGADVVKVYEEDPSFDLIVLGSNMAGIDSLTVTKLIRQLQVAKRPYIVGIKGPSTADNTEKAIKAGMDAYMLKLGLNGGKNEGVLPSNVRHIFG